MPDPFVALMRRYVVDYTNSHDLSVCDEIMEPDYDLRMGVARARRARRGLQAGHPPPARAVPGAGPDRARNRHLGRPARTALLRARRLGPPRRRGRVLERPRALRWNGSRLTGNRVEQDYLARRRQLADGVPDPVAPPAPAPWDTRAAPPDPDVEDAARHWAGTGLRAVPGVVFDDGRDDTALVEPDDVVVDDLFSAGRHAALHATMHGRYAGGLDGLDDRVGASAVLHANALVVVVDGRVAGGHVVRDRLGLVRALAAAEPVSAR